MGLVQATSPSGATTLVPITPCRAVDTRPDLTVGPRSTPLGSGETMTVVSAGGECTGLIPPGATGLSMNVTAVGATESTFLTIWPEGPVRPNASSLNPEPSTPPTPNAVTTAISAAGNFQVFNLTGSVDIIIDINGYYVDHDHDDRYYPKAQADQRYLAPHVVVPHTSFVAEDNDLDLRYTSSYVFDVYDAGSRFGCMLAPAELPHGAVVTRLRARVGVPADPVGGGVVLERVHLTQNSLTTMAFTPLTPTGAAGLGLFVDDTIEDAEVDAFNHRYTVTVCGFEARIFDVIVNYVMPT